MPLIADATLVVGAGNYFTAPVGTELPVDLTDPSEPWDNIGHTAIDDILTQSSEGGEATVLGTLQNPTLRTTRAPRSETFSIALQQFDESALRLYYGSNMVSVEGGKLLGVPSNPQPTTRAFLAVFIDGSHTFAFYAPRAEIFRGDDLEIPDTESLATLPLVVTPLQHGENSWPYAITPLEGAEDDPSDL